MFVVCFGGWFCWLIGGDLGVLPRFEGKYWCFLRHYQGLSLLNNFTMPLLESPPETFTTILYHLSRALSKAFQFLVMVKGF